MPKLIHASRYGENKDTAAAMKIGDVLTMPNRAHGRAIARAAAALGMRCSVRAVVRGNRWRVGADFAHHVTRLV